MADPSIQQRIERATRDVEPFGEDRNRLAVIGSDGLLLHVPTDFAFLFSGAPQGNALGGSVDEALEATGVHVLDLPRAAFAFRAFDDWRRDEPVVFRARNSQGQRVVVEGSCAGGFAEQGALTLLLRDHSEAWDALKQLASDERRFRMVADASLDMVTETDAEGYFVYASAACKDVLGYAPEQLVGTKALDLHHPEDIERFAGEVREGLRSGAPFRVAVHRLRCRDGRWIWVDATGISYRDGKGRRRTLGVARDVSAQIVAEAMQRELGERVLRSQKLESLGALAGGVAHEFNNLLTPIVGNVGLALLDLPEDSPIRKRIEMIKTAAQRATALTRQMLAYAGQGVPSVDVVNVSRAIEETALLLESSAAAKSRVRYELQPDVSLIEVDSAHIVQVVMNLVANASESLPPEGGQIVVRTGNVHADQAYLDACFIGEHLDKGLYVFIEVEDDGPGIPETDRARIFDPFFTTRFTGRGLGLAAVDGIVRGYRGALDLLSEPGHGTRIRVLFPTAGVTSRATRPRKDVSEAPALTATNATRGTVLVVDDDASAGSLMTDVLERAGFRVLVAESGAVAVKVFERNSDELDAVVLDYTMPLVSGAEVFDTLRKLRPDVRVLMVSGYAQSSAAQDLMRRGLRAFLPKPFEPDDLVRAVQGLLDD